MSSTYAGNPANFPASITIPSGGDNVTAASVNVALEGLADRTAHLAGYAQIVQIVSYTADDATLAHAQIGSDIDSTSWTASSVLATTTADVLTGDIVIVHCQVWAAITAVASDAMIRITTGTGHEISSSVLTVGQTISPHTLVGYYVAGSDRGPITVAVQGKITENVGEKLRIYKPSVLVATIYRSL